MRDSHTSKYRRLKIVGDVRSCDQVIRLHDTGSTSQIRASGFEIDASNWKDREIFIHEWCHHFQFSTVPVGILVSLIKRNSLQALIRVTDGSRDLKVPLQKPSRLYEEPTKDFSQRIDDLNQLWGRWEFPKNTPDRFKTVRLTSSNLIVTFENGEDLRLHLNANQLFEGFAWLVECAHRHVEEVPIPERETHNLEYTWPIWVLEEKAGPFQSGTKALKLFFDLIGMVLVSSYYHESLFMLCSGAFNLQIAKDLAKEFYRKGISFHSVFHHFIRNYSELEMLLDGVREVASLASAFETFVERSGLPKLIDVISCTEQIANALSDRIRLEIVDAVSRAGAGANLDLDFFRSEWDLFTTSAKNIRVLQENLSICLLSPYPLMDRFSVPVCAVLGPNGYNWPLIWETSDLSGVLDSEKSRNRARSQIRQRGLALYEHILFQICFSRHLACYGSPEWQNPINCCQYSVECMATANKRGISFCKDADWRTTVGRILLSSGGWSEESLRDSNIPGVANVVAEARNVLDRWGVEVLCLDEDGILMHPGYLFSGVDGSDLGISVPTAPQMRRDFQTFEAELAEDVRARVFQCMRTALLEGRSRNESRTGYEDFGCFVPYSKLSDCYPEFLGSPFSDDFGEKVVRHAVDFDNSAAVTQLALDAALRSEDADSRKLAGRIRKRIASSAIRLRQIKPLLYYCLGDSGMGISVAIYDEFWTDAW